MSTKREYKCFAYETTLHSAGECISRISVIRAESIEQIKKAWCEDHDIKYDKQEHLLYSTGSGNIIELSDVFQISSEEYDHAKKSKLIKENTCLIDLYNKISSKK